MSGVAEISPKYLAEVASNTIRSGYKQTEVGVIPEDWSLVKLEKLTSLIIDGTHHTPTYTSFGIPFLRVTDIQGELDEVDFKFISEAEHASLIKRCKPEKGDLLLSKNGTIGIPRIVTWDWDFSVFVSLALIKLKKNLLEVEYLEQFFKSDFLNLQLAQRAKQGTVTNLHLEEIRELLIPIPVNKKEQTAIANALSDVDALISELEKLIAKKQAIKTATMQQLLTGRTRLPQFALREDGTPKGTKPSELGEIPEDWAVKTYGEVFTFLSTSTNSRADLSEDGDFGYVHYGDIHTEWNNKLDLNKERLPRISKSIVSSAFVMGGDLIMADASEDYEGIGKTVEVFNVGEKQIVAGLHTFLLRDKEKVLADGFRGYLHSIPAVKSSFDRLATGMKVYGISKNNLSFVCIPVPSLEEQTAVATILSDMDEEIRALEQRLSKTRQIKQGMMQELLTGKTRLLQGIKND